MRGPVDKFFRDRGTHLAAMIAYFALLSFVPLVFLALALLGLFGRADESSYLVTELRTVLPETTVSLGRIIRVVTVVQENAAALGIVGGVFLLWTSLSLFSVLESAFNIVYHRPNRPFLRGKAVAFAFLAGLLVVLFAGLVVGAAGFEVADRYAGGVVANTFVALTLSVLVSTLAVFAFLVTAYHHLTNEPLRLRDVVPGAALAAVLLQASFQSLPAFVRLTGDVIALQVLGGPAILLVWLYVMANVIVFGAEVNWWLAYGGRPGSVDEEEGAGLA